MELVLNDQTVMIIAGQSKFLGKYSEDGERIILDIACQVISTYVPNPQANTIDQHVILDPLGKLIIEKKNIGALSLLPRDCAIYKKYVEFSTGLHLGK